MFVLIVLCSIRSLDRKTLGTDENHFVPQVRHVAPSVCHKHFCSHLTPLGVLISSSSLSVCCERIDCSVAAAAARGAAHSLYGHADCGTVCVCALLFALHVALLVAMLCSAMPRMSVNLFVCMHQSVHLAQVAPQLSAARVYVRTERAEGRCTRLAPVYLFVCLSRLVHVSIFVNCQFALCVRRGFSDHVVVLLSCLVAVRCPGCCTGIQEYLQGLLGTSCSVHGGSHEGISAHKEYMCLIVCLSVCIFFVHAQVYEQSLALNRPLADLQEAIQGTSFVILHLSPELVPLALQVRNIFSFFCRL